MTDEGIKEVRRIRHQISEECGHDVDRVVSYYQKVEQELRESGRFHFTGDGGKSLEASTATTESAGTV